MFKNLKRSRGNKEMLFWSTEVSEITGLSKCQYTQLYQLKINSIRELDKYPANCTREKNL